MENLRRLREAAGLTQMELSARVGVTQAALSAWEVGTAIPSLPNTVRLADALEISLDELLGRNVAGA